MSQILRDQLSLDRISRLWAAETEQEGVVPEDIAEDLVTAAELGEFEHTVYARADAPLVEYIYKEDWEDNESEDKTGKQPHVGPYRSALSMRDGHRVNAVAIQNYIKARQTAPGATDRETRRIVASEIFLSVEGLRRWCDEPGFAEWAKRRGLSQPQFIKLVDGNRTGQASAVVEEPEEADAPSPQSDAETPETQRGKQARKTKEKYVRWYDLAQEIKGEGKWTRPTEIAAAVAKREKDSTERGVNATNIRRRLDKHYPEWANRVRAQKPSAK